MIFMPQRKLQIYLRSERLAAGLSQAELGELLGYGEDFVRKCELGQRKPTIKFILGCELIFGRSAAESFPALVEKIQEEIGRNAASLDARLRNRTDAASLKKIRLLRGIVERMASFHNL
jgi:transcriptional regulator with XRE-family HTH domain